MNSSDLSTFSPEIRLAVEAAQDKQAGHITVLDLQGTGAFAEYFVVCSGESTPQLRAIADAIEESLDRSGRHISHREGRSGAEWLLLDYGDFIVHIFSERAREYYDLERLWRNANRVDLTEPMRSRPSLDESEAGAAQG